MNLDVYRATFFVRERIKRRGLPSVATSRSRKDASSTAASAHRFLLLSVRALETYQAQT